jgi:AraC-like DNA-binding protein
MAVLFIGLMVLVMAATILVNKLFFEQFYTHRLQNTLVSAYTQIDEHITEQGFDRDFFTGPFTQMCNSNNMNVVVVDENYNTVIGNSPLIAARIWGYIVAGDNDDAEILVTKDHYIIQKKLEEARRLIQTTSLSVSAVAVRLGYSNFSHFAAAYRRAFGVTPAEDRKTP